MEKKYFPLFRVRRYFFFVATFNVISHELFRLRERCRGLLAERRFPEVETDIFSMLDLLYKAGSEVSKFVFSCALIEAPDFRYEKAKSFERFL